MKAITCEFCETSAPEGADMQEAVEKALADGFHEIRKPGGAVQEVYYLCDICWYTNKEFAPNSPNWHNVVPPAPPSQVSVYEQNQSPNPRNPWRAAQASIGRTEYRRPIDAWG